MTTSPPARFTSGVNTHKASHPLNQLPAPDPLKIQSFVDDFDRFTAAATGVTGWHADEVDPAGSDNVDATVIDAAGGVIQFGPGAAAGDNINYQWGTGTDVLEIFKVEAGKKAWLRVRFKIEDADQNIFHAGLSVAADDQAGTEPADQFLFRTVAGALEFAAGKTAATEVTASLGDLADDVFYTATAYYDGRSTVKVYLEDAAGDVVAAGSVDVSDGDLLPDTEMTVGFGVEAADTGADLTSMDYIAVFVER